MQYGSFFRRFLAVVLDALIILIPAWIANSGLPVLGSVLVGLLYSPLFESSRVQATPGKRAMGLIVADLNGNRITLKAAFIRYGMKIVSAILLFIGHIIALFTERKQALHDLVAETVVLSGERPGAVVDAWVDQFRAAFTGARAGINAASESSSGTSSYSGRPSHNALEDLERLQKLRDRGALTEDEFQAEKKRILAR